jgi:hypothetical protein
MNLSRQRHQAAPAKKLVIKPLKARPQLPDTFEADSWAKLRDAVHAVQGKRPVSCSLEELYGAVEDMCMHKLSARLYDLLQEECDRHAAQQVMDYVCLRSLRGGEAVATPIIRNVTETPRCACHHLCCHPSPAVSLISFGCSLPSSPISVTPAGHTAQRLVLPRPLRLPAALCRLVA